jgi:hypothetical protein
MVARLTGLSPYVVRIWLGKPPGHSAPWMRHRSWWWARQPGKFMN